MARDHNVHIERPDCLQCLEPDGNAGTWTCEPRVPPHRDVTGKQHAVLLDQEDRVTPRVRGPHCMHAHGDPAQVHAVLVVEEHVRRPEISPFEEIRQRLCSLRESFRVRQTELLDVLLLVARPDHRGVLRESPGAEVVFGVIVGGNDVELVVVAELPRLSQHDLAVRQTQPGVNDQCCPIADNDTYVRNVPATVIENHVNVIGNLQGIVLLDQRRRIGSLCPAGHSPADG